MASQNGKMCVQRLSRIHKRRLWGVLCSVAQRPIVGEHYLPELLSVVQESFPKQRTSLHDLANNSSAYEIEEAQPFSRV